MIIGFSLVLGLPMNVFSWVIFDLLDVRFLLKEEILCVFIRVYNYFDS